MRLELGQPAPNIVGTSDDGRPINLQDLRGQWVVLYFYPRANSLGCSIEAQRFEASLPEFERLGAQVIGISTDKEEGQASFREKCHLTFPLIPDPSKSICKAYGVYGGAMALLGASGRASFIIDPAGKLVYQLHNIAHTVHVPGALRELERLQAAPA